MLQPLFSQPLLIQPLCTVTTISIPAATRADMTIPRSFARRVWDPRPVSRSGHRAIASALLIAVAGTAASAQAPVQRVENDVAIFAALDKVTARISRLEVKLNETAKFGSLRVTPRACIASSPIDPPKTTTFVEVEEVQLDGQQKKIFSGWMFAESPGLNAVEHPVFDVWLTECIKPKAAAQQPGARPATPAGTQPQTDDTRRRRPPR